MNFLSSVILVILGIALYLVYRQQQENMTLPAPTDTTCPFGFYLTCISRDLPGSEDDVPFLPEKLKDVCPHTHVPACLPDQAHQVKPKIF